MQSIIANEVQTALDRFRDDDLYIHVETTNGAYARNPFGMFGRNLAVRFSRATITGTGPYRVALVLSPIGHTAQQVSGGIAGWIYVEGLTHWEIDGAGRLLMAGHDEKGLLTAALEFSREPLPLGRGE